MGRHLLAVAGAIWAGACAKNSMAPTSVPTTSAIPTTNTSAPRLQVSRFIAFGDSITYGEDGRNVASDPLSVRPLVQVESPYPSVLLFELQQKYIAQILTVFNDGARGEAAGDPGAFARFDRDVVGGGYQSVLLMEGANDLGSDGIPAAIGGLRRMVEDAKSHSVRVFLATIPPEQQNADPFPYARNHPPEEVLALNDQIRALASAEGVPLVDVYEAFPSPNANDLYSLGLLSRDGLHPLQHGYDVIAGTFSSAIRQALELAPSPVLPTSKST